MQRYFFFTCHVIYTKRCPKQQKFDTLRKKVYYSIFGAIHSWRSWLLFLAKIAKFRDTFKIDQET